MSTPFSRESDTFDADGCRVYLRPFEGRVPVRVAGNAATTGLPDSAFEALTSNRVQWFWLDPAGARVLLSNVLLVLRTRAPWRALFCGGWPYDEDATPELVGERIAKIQRRIERADATRRYRAVFVATTALVFGTVLLGIVAARAVRALDWSPLLAGLATGAATRRAFRSQIAPLGVRHPVLGLTTLAPVPVFSFAESLGAVPLGSVALGASGVGLLAWQIALYVDTPKPPRALPIPPVCPHTHYSAARVPNEDPHCEFVAGSRYVDLDATWRRQLTVVSRSTEPFYAYGGFYWTLSDSAHHGLVAGVTGSGKTATLLLVYRALAPNMLSVWYDHRRTDYPKIVAAMPNGEDDVALLFPLDERGKAWAIARDVTNPIAAASLAAWLTKHLEREGFWKFAGTGGLAVVFATLPEVKGLDWTLLDAVRLATPRLLTRFLEQSPTGQHFLESLLTSDSQIATRPGDVIATVAALLSRLTPAAIAAEELHQAGRTFSIRDWARGATQERAIVFSSHPRYAEALAPYNQALVSQISSSLLEQPGNYSVPRAIAVFDELQTAPEFDLFELLTNGRDKGVTVWMATQDLPGLVKRYGSREAVDSLVGSVRHQAFLRCCDVTAQKAAALAGDVTYIRHQIAHQWSRGTSDARSVGPSGASSTKTTSDSIGGSSTPGTHTEKLVPPHLLPNAPIAGPEHGLVGYFRREDEQWFPSLHWQWLLDRLPRPASIPAELLVDVDRLTFEPLSDSAFEDLIRRRVGDGGDEGSGNADDDFFGDL